MKAAKLPDLRRALKELPREDLIALCARMAVFKKENKELLTYLLFEAEHEPSYVASVKEWMVESFAQIQSTRYYLIKKSVRKILKQTKTFIRYSKNKETEVALLLHFCEQLTQVRPSIRKNKVLRNSLERQWTLAKNKSEALHPDIRYDYEETISKLAAYL
ncbi:hypothetical protein [Croceiramulus getboli]|nr:hypothetical protein P8624_10800 [Flavobacteriaceae bacterium YJPT1-3]